MLEVIKTFPSIRHAFLYGSSLLNQSPDPSRMVDFIFLVDDAATWHASNLRIHPNHYSNKARKLGAVALASSAEKAAGFHYNPYVELEGQVPLTQMCKYGVIDYTRATSDLKDWDTFYLAARMQKPVKTLIADEEIEKLQVKNIERAVAVGLLTTPQTVAESDFYVHISKLSYIGDPRLEESGKIEKMVSDNFPAFQRLYLPAFNALSPCLLYEGGVIEVLSNQRQEDLTRLASFIPMSLCPKPETLLRMDFSQRKELLFRNLETLNKKSIHQQYRHYLKTTDLRVIFKYSLRKMRKAVVSWVSPS